MDGDESKKIINALGSVGFEVQRLEMEKVVCGDEYTGALIIRITKKQELKDE
jgi:hypothetical protein